jgi:hypothetical protein
MPTIEYFDTFAPFGSLGGPGDPWVIGVGADPLSLRAHLGQDLLLIAQPWADVSTEGTPDLDMFPPFGALPDGWLDGEAARTDVYVAATRGRSTDNDDEPPAQYVPGRLTPINFGTRLFDGVDPLARGGFNFGVITLIDPDGLFNGIVGYSWDNVPLIIKRGPRNTPFVDWPVVARFRSAGMLRDMDNKTIQLRDIGWQLAGPLHGETYAGTGGVEGDADLTGSIKPWALGHCFNIEPVLLSASDQIFQWSLSSSEELTAMRHGGVDFPIDADYADYAALAAAVIPAGECATCLALSLVRPNVTLEFGIRVDVVGDADDVNGHGVPTTREAIIRRVATHRGTSLLDEFSELDQSSFQRMNAYHSAPVGWYFNGDITKQAAIDLMLSGVLGWSIFTPDGRLRLGWLNAPEGQTATLNLVGRIDDIGKPRLVATSPPRRGTRISWQWNYGPQPDRASLAGGVSDDDALLYSQEAQYAPALSPDLATLYPTAKLVTIPQAGFRDEADAMLEATRQQEIFSVVRNRYERQLQIDPFIDVMGVTFNVSDDPLNAPQLQVCVGINTTGNSSVNTLEFFA